MPVPLGELEAKLAGDLLSWLCHERVFGSIALRNALLAVQRYPVSRVVQDTGKGKTPVRTAPESDCGASGEEVGG